MLIGSGQSAAEIFIDLFDQQLSTETGLPKFHIYWLTRSPGFFPMENTPLGLENFSPDYMAYFHQLPKGLKDKLPNEQAHLYKGISSKTIRDIYERLYHRSIGQTETHVTLAGHHQLENAELVDKNQIKLKFFQTQKQYALNLNANTVIAATGYRYPTCNFLNKLQHLIPLDAQGHWQIDQSHRLNYEAHGQIYIQNTHLHHHGVGTPDLGLGAFRSAHIANQILEENYFQLEARQTFQEFQLNQHQSTQTHVRHTKSSQSEDMFLHFSGKQSLAASKCTTSREG